MTPGGRMFACQVLAVAATLTGCGGANQVVTQTVTQTAPAAAAPKQPMQWAGNGTRSLGTVTVPADGTLQWSMSPGAAILIGSDLNPNGPNLNVGSQDTNGSSAIQAGTYRNVQVVSTGTWNITIR